MRIESISCPSLDRKVDLLKLNYIHQMMAINMDSGSIRNKWQPINANIEEILNKINSIKN